MKMNIVSITCSLIFGIVSIVVIRNCALYHKPPIALSALYSPMIRVDEFLSHWKIIT